jgi:hypothetical protein
MPDVKLFVSRQLRRGWGGWLLLLHVPTCLGFGQLQQRQATASAASRQQTADLNTTAGLNTMRAHSQVEALRATEQSI